MTIKEKLLEKMSAQCGQKITEINLISWEMIEPYINELEASQIKVVPTPNYRAMIYAAVATMHFYSKEIHILPQMSVEQFRNMNPALIDRVAVEIKQIFNYELSWEQMGRAIYGYVRGELYPESPTHTEAYRLPHS